VTLTQLQQLAAQVGFPNPALAAAVAEAESGGNPSATDIVTNPAPGNGPERSFGLWQINTLAHPSYNETSLLDPTYNAQAAFTISSGGTNWNPWSTYTKGLYKQYYSPGLVGSPVQAPAAPWIPAILIVAAGVGIAYTIERGIPRPLRRLLG
jgi:Lysozyme like domain